MPCQDYSTIEYLENNGIAVLVSDGAGSARYGGDGAKIAVDAALAFINKDPDNSEAFAKNCLQELRVALIEAAKKEGVDAREFSCTFLAVIVRNGNTLLIHIGDGGIVLDWHGALELASAPMKAGEYANQTYFLPNRESMKRIRHFKKVPRRIAVFSDGVERLGLNLCEGSVHPPFFEPFFATLAKENAAIQEFNVALDNYLKCNDEVNKCTDDDKTLALAVNLKTYSAQVSISQATSEEAASASVSPSKPASRTKAPEHASKPKPKRVSPKDEKPPVPVAPDGLWSKIFVILLIGVLVMVFAAWHAYRTYQACTKVSEGGGNFSAPDVVPPLSSFCAEAAIAASRRMTRFMDLFRTS
ncbi:hypothetical protein FACS189475_00980 [Betaproteobacteria bacterium]|nr:hypothetical protein FACS189475_00980 [Betaproteobacteria bacterium]